MKTSDKRILTSHVGSLIRPPEVLDHLRAKQAGKGFSDKATAARRIEKAVDAATKEVKTPKAAKAPSEPRAPKAPKAPKEPGAKTDREIMREFLTEGKEFVVKDIADLLGTTNSNASTGVQLLKTRPSKGYLALITEKTADGKLKVVQAPTLTPVEAADAA